MKVVINGQVFDPEVTGIILVFKDDNDRVNHVRNLDNMENKPGPRVYSIHPDGSNPELILESMYDAIEKCK